MRSFFVIMWVCGVVTASLGNSVYWYEITKGEQKERVEWRKQMYCDNKIVFESTNYLENVSHVMLCHPNLETQSWKFYNNSENIEYSVTREGDSLIYSGVMEGEPVEKIVLADNLPWYQIHGISFPQLLEKGFDKEKFISIRPEDGKLFTLIAERKQVEAVHVNGVSVDAIRVEVRLAGLLGSLGKVNYWFRESDFVFVKYEGITGFSGKDAVVYQLQEYMPATEQAAVPVKSLPLDF